MSDDRLQRLVDDLAPAAVSRPSSARELVDVLGRAERDQLAVWPLGAGLHVRAPRAIERPWTWLDMRGLDAILGIDRRSAVVHVGAGATLGAVERALEGERLTLGPARVDGPDDATVGGLLARHWPWPTTFGQPTLRGACIGLTAHYRARDGRYHYLPAPRKASGPDLRHLFLGAEGRHGAITEVWLAARRQPERELRVTLRASSVTGAVRATRAFLASGALPWHCALHRHAAGVDLDVHLAGAAPLVELWARKLTASDLEPIAEPVASPTAVQAVQVAGPWSLLERALEVLDAAVVTGATAWGGRLLFDATGADAVASWSWPARFDPRASAPLGGDELTRRLSRALDADGLWLTAGTRP